MSTPGRRRTVPQRDVGHHPGVTEGLELSNQTGPIRSGLDPRHRLFGH